MYETLVPKEIRDFVAQNSNSFRSAKSIRIYFSDRWGEIYERLEGQNFMGSSLKVLGKDGRRVL